jgi:hypothetical protein
MTLIPWQTMPKGMIAKLKITNTKSEFTSFINPDINQREQTLNLLLSQVCVNEHQQLESESSLAVLPPQLLRRNNFSSWSKAPLTKTQAKFETSTIVLLRQLIIAIFHLSRQVSIFCLSLDCTYNTKMYTKCFYSTYRE